MEQTTIKEIKAYIKLNVKKDFTLKDLADMMGYSPYHLSRSFKAATGLTIMEYTRKCRISSAKNEIAKGKNICDTALDHCFQTHAGFTRAFISIIGYAPKYYKELNMIIKTVSTIEELSTVLDFQNNEFINEYQNFKLPKKGEKYSFEFWKEQLKEFPSLLLYSESDNKITGSAFGWVDSDCITVAHCCVLKNRRKEGIGSVLMGELEKATLKLGYHRMVLGAQDNVFGFYEKLGYSASILIQSEEDSVDDLLTLTEDAEVIYTNIYDDYINQVCLSASANMVNKIRYRYKSIYPKSNVQVVMAKSL